MAIAFDAATNGGETYYDATPITWSHTTTGSNVLLLVWVIANAQPTSVTYAGNACTLSGSDAAGATGFTWYCYTRAVGSGAGAQDIVITCSGTPQVYALACSYTGVNQSTTLDSMAGNDYSASGFSMTTTVVASGCWLVGANYDESTVPTVSGVTTLRVQNTVNLIDAYDSNGTVSTGSQSLTFSASGTAGHWYIVSLAPAGAAALTITQEGYRWRLDDGSESTATWAAAQDTGITAPANAIRRLRFILDTSGDANAATYQLEYKEANDAGWTKVA